TASRSGWPAAAASGPARWWHSRAGRPAPWPPPRPARGSSNAGTRTRRARATGPLRPWFEPGGSEGPAELGGDPVAVGVEQVDQLEEGVLEGDQAGAVVVQAVGQAVDVLQQGGEPAGLVLVVQGLDEGGIAQAVPAWPDPLRGVVGPGQQDLADGPLLAAEHPQGRVGRSMLSERASRTSSMASMTSRSRR